MSKKELEHDKINIKVNTYQIDEATKKAYRLNRLLKEANSLADELASKKIELVLEV